MKIQRFFLSYTYVVRICSIKGFITSFKQKYISLNAFKCIFLNENVWIAIKISLKIVPKGPINNIPALVQIMAWRCSGYKPLSKPMIVCLPTHLCVTRPQWVNSCQMAVVAWASASNLQWNFYENIYIFIKEISFKNFICRMLDILFSNQCLQ